ncbi:hypothetical protein AB0D10_04295 [Kitasatospora sp. NPDC048545]|uniref:hypothetical protein n=1 Tax=Kitasatospora sp. NPDC048545 TaxID=3157208 RepID=UPI0033D7096F
MCAHGTRPPQQSAAAAGRRPERQADVRIDGGAEGPAILALVPGVAAAVAVQPPQAGQWANALAGEVVDRGARVGEVVGR